MAVGTDLICRSERCIRLANNRKRLEKGSQGAGRCLRYFPDHLETSI